MHPDNPKLIHFVPYCSKERKTFGYRSDVQKLVWAPISETPSSKTRAGSAMCQRKRSNKRARLEIYGEVNLELGRKPITENSVDMRQQTNLCRITTKVDVHIKVQKYQHKDQPTNRKHKQKQTPSYIYEYTYTNEWVSVSVCVYLIYNIYIDNIICVCACIHTNIYMYIYTYICICIYIYTCMHACMQFCIHADVCVLLKPEVYIIYIY